ENARIYQKVEWKSIVDELTGVYNRRGLFLLGQREVERAQRTGRPLSVLFMDVDGFRDFNNRYSYETGDAVLQLVGAQLRNSLRSMDIVGRYGGDEFVVLLPETDLPTAHNVAERLRQTVAAAEILVNGQSLHITLSIGISLLQEHSLSLKDLLRQSASLLRRSKDEGRNRVTAD
ncbi:MAG: GGDEF domain-containing protein, partial [Longilinea sp.]|nr:GGDEF domain-containing protein [Longilinea sp.]